MTTTVIEPDKYIQEFNAVGSLNLTDAFPVQTEDGGEGTTFKVTAEVLAEFVSNYFDAPKDGSTYARRNGEWIQIA